MMISLKTFIKIQTLLKIFLMTPQQKVLKIGDLFMFIALMMITLYPRPTSRTNHIEAYNETYEEIHEVCNVYDDTPSGSPIRDEVLEFFTTCNTFETKNSKDDHYEHEEVSYIQECSF